MTAEQTLRAYLARVDKHSPFGTPTRYDAEEALDALVAERADIAAAYFQARKDQAALEAALAFYADEGTYEESTTPDPARWATGIVPIHVDQGDIARAALATADLTNPSRGQDT